jgi:hypothetical protein
MRAEREAVADLIAVLYDYLSSVVNLKLAYDASAQGAEPDLPRIGELHEVSKRFGPVIIRARLLVRIPEARPVLDLLEYQHIRMTGHLNLTLMGEPSAEFVEHFREFHRVISESKVALERAALAYDGRLVEGVRPVPVEVKPRQPPPGEAADASTSQ